MLPHMLTYFVFPLCYSFNILCVVYFWLGFMAKTFVLLLFSMEMWNPLPEAYNLYTILQDYTEKYTSDWQNKHMQASRKVCVLLPHVGQT